MVERLRAAIERARALREGEASAREPAAGAVSPASYAPTSPAPASPAHTAWAALPETAPTPDALERGRIAAALPDHRFYESFNVLRAKLLGLCRDAGWRRIGFTSPTKGCGKTSVTLNLAYSISRNAAMHVIALDLDLRNPSVGRLLGLKSRAPIRDLLGGHSAPEAHLARIGQRLAVGLSERHERHSAELLGARETGEALTAIETRFDPDIMLCDLPPLGVGDDVLAALGHLDGIVLVAAAGETTAKQIAEAERSLEGTGRLIGVVFNKCSESTTDKERYYEDATAG